MNTLSSICAVCLFVSSAGAAYAGAGVTGLAGTNMYEFDARESTVTQTGGFAGVHRVYYVKGRFALTVDPNAGTASFAQVAARATDDSPFDRKLDPNEVFNMTGLTGTVADDGSIRFEGRASDGSSALITLVCEETTVHLRGETVPPPQSADFFLYELDACAQRKYGGGTGDPNEPYRIYTAEQMNAIGAEPSDWDRHFRLMADVDLADSAEGGLSTIGYFRDARDCRAFSGVFDGNGHRILHFSLQSLNDNAAGLFGYVSTEEAQIKNLALVDPNVDAQSIDAVGCLVGYLQQGTVSNCHVTNGCSSGHFKVGGLVGFCDHATIADSSATGQIRGKSGVGGLVGACSYGDILRCHSGGTVLSHDLVGGLVGEADFFVTLADCYANAGVEGDLYAGGLAGSFLHGSVTNCYSAGAVSSTTLSGGLIGFRGNMAGALLAKITASFWDCDSSGQPTSEGGIGLTTLRMRTASTFLAAGWDFVGETKNGTDDIWSIQEGQDYPRLAWEQRPSPAAEE